MNTKPMADFEQRLFLRLPPQPDILDGLEALLDNPRVACAHIVARPGAALPGADTLAAMVARLQRSDIAVLLDNPDDVRQCKADGVHATLGGGGDLDSLNAAIKSLKPGHIVGVGGLYSHHAAMSAGETDVDYVMFGETGPGGKLPPFADVLEKAAWWSEVFTVPCIAHAADLQTAELLAASGCDFLSISIDPADFPYDSNGLKPAEAIARAIQAVQVSA